MNTETDRKSLKKTGNQVGTALLIYIILNFAVAIIWMFIELIAMALETPDILQQENLFKNALTKMEESGASSIAAVCVGVLFLILFFRKKVSVKQIFVSRKTMTRKTFWQLLCVFMGAQLVTVLGFGLIETGLNLFGFSAMGDMESATAATTTLSGFLYMAVLAPLAEEIVYRGFILKSLEKYGKVFAIFVSAVLFGTMHMNLAQDIGAVLVGFVLAYVAVEYSAVWSILLHIINNALFGELFSMAIGGFGKLTQIIINYAVMIIFFAFGTGVLYRNKKAIRRYLQENKPAKKSLVYVFTSFAVIVLILFEFVIAIDGVQPLV